MRSLARNCILYKVGIDENIHLWLDYWHPDGVLHEVYGHRVIYEAASQIRAKQTSVLKDKNWDLAASKIGRSC